MFIPAAEAACLSCRGGHVITCQLLCAMCAPSKCLPGTAHSLAALLSLTFLSLVPLPCSVCPSACLVHVPALTLPFALPLPQKASCPNSVKCGVFA